MKAIELFTQIAKDKETINLFADELQDNITNGEIDNLEFTALCNTLVKRLTDLKQEAMKQAMNEAEKYGKSFEYKGFKFTIKEAGARYDFSKCNYPTWNRLNEEITEKQKEAKECELFLKSLNKATTLVDEECGEVCTIYPPEKKSTTILEVR